MTAVGQVPFDDVDVNADGIREGCQVGVNHGGRLSRILGRSLLTSSSRPTPMPLRVNLWQGPGSRFFRARTVP
ncbi:hypothetical protein ACFQ51_42555 [Streptomyces kaempferi]